MSDYSAAEIWIGGKIAASLAIELCQAIANAGVSLQWGDAPFAPTSPDELSNICKQRDGAKLLWFCDDQARWGQFDELESFLIARGIPFDRISEAGCEYDAERLWCRPGCKPVRFPSHRTGAAIVSAAILHAVGDRLDVAIEHFRQGAKARGIAALRRLRRFVHQNTPKVLPALESFEIVAGPANPRHRPRNRKR